MRDHKGTILIGWVDNTGIRQTGRFVKRDLNWFPEIESAPEAHVLIWCNNGTMDDYRAAQEYIKTDMMDRNAEAFMIPSTEADPKGFVRRGLLGEL